MDERIRFLWWDIRWLALYHTRRLVWYGMGSTARIHALYTPTLYTWMAGRVYWRLHYVSIALNHALDSLYQDYAY